MKTLEEIKKALADEANASDFEHLLFIGGEEMADELARRYATEVAREALKDARGNAKILRCSFRGGNGGLDLSQSFEGCCEETYRIDGESITDTEIKLP